MSLARRHADRLLLPALALAVAAAALGATPATPAAAQSDAGTIVYVHDHNVWIMAADDPGSAQPVTTDGTAGSPYLSPTQDDHGRILAIAGGEGGDIVWMDQQGELLADPFRPTDGNLVDLDVEADGEIFVHTSYRTYQGAIVAPSVGFAYADGRDSSDIASTLFDETYATFSTDQTLLTSYDRDQDGSLVATVATFGPGDAELRHWFRPCETDQSSVNDYGLCFPEFADATEDSERLVVTVGSDADVPIGARLWIFDMAGPAPAQPTWGCELVAPVRTSRVAESYFQSPEWSPDGSALVYEYFADPPDGLASGIYLATGVDDDCDRALSSAELIVPGGSQPDWSPAPLGATAGAPPPTDPPPPPGGGGSTPPEPDEARLTLPDDGVRLDGGGAADPVGQAVATSQQVWADGGAALVVLATADRFPDALAGSALAGELGPVLVTPGDQLGPGVGAEISRVTGGDGVIVILGGTAAISEAVAAQARAAAGSPDCPAPFPSDCRYAGQGREETAALIGATVLALNDGSGGRVLLARGDAFADAITGGAYAAEAGVPILLTPSDQLNASTRAFIEANGIEEVIVLGGTAAVSDAVVAAMPVESRRIAGSDRTATAAAIATDLWQAEGLAGGGIVLVNARHDDGWQTALAAAVVSALANAPQLAVENPPAGLSPATTAAAEVIGGPVAAFGGTGLVSDAQLTAALQAAGTS